jgi:tRNA G46 methylase TrmB
MATVQEMTLGNFKIPSRSEIESAVGPYVTKRMPVTSREWQEIFDRELRKEQKIHRKQKIRRWLPWSRHARPQALVSDHYETHWSELPWPRTKDPKPDEKGIVCLWGNEGLLVRRSGRKRAHHLLFSRLLRELNVKTALEVGAGNGINLLVLSTLFPEIEWTGVELTAAGVQVAKSIQSEAQLPTVLQEFANEPVRDAKAHRRVTLHQGDATRLPFAD